MILSTTVTEIKDIYFSHKSSAHRGINSPSLPVNAARNCALIFNRHGNSFGGFPAQQINHSRREGEIGAGTPNQVKPSSTYARLNADETLRALNLKPFATRQCSVSQPEAMLKNQQQTGTGMKNAALAQNTPQPGAYDQLNRNPLLNDLNLRSFSGLRGAI